MLDSISRIFYKFDGSYCKHAQKRDCLESLADCLAFPLDASFGVRKVSARSITTIESGSQIYHARSTLTRIFFAVLTLPLLPLVISGIFFRCCSWSHRDAFTSFTKDRKLPFVAYEVEVKNIFGSSKDITQKHTSKVRITENTTVLDLPTFCPFSTGLNATVHYTNKSGWSCTKFGTYSVHNKSKPQKFSKIKNLELFDSERVTEKDVTKVTAMVFWSSL